MIPIEVLKELSLKSELTENEQRLLVMYYILYNKGIMVKEIMTCVINDVEQFKKNLEITKDYFKSFITNEASEKARV